MPQLQLRNEIHEEAHPISHENWRNPNRGSSNYFQTINWSHTTSRGRHICFQTTVLRNYCTCYYETHMVWSFDTFYSLTVTLMSKNKRVRTLCNILEFLNKKLHYRNLFANFFLFCTGLKIRIQNTECYVSSL